MSKERELQRAEQFAAMLYDYAKIDGDREALKAYIKGDGDLVQQERHIEYLLKHLAGVQATVFETIQEIEQERKADMEKILRL